MLQDTINLKNRHAEFLKTVSKTEIVYALKSQDGFATSSSTLFEDDQGHSIGILCFWAQKSRAKSCAIGVWEHYEVTEIPLTTFIENWCVGMTNDELLVGTQFDQNMFGYEVDPLDLILELASELKALEKDLNFKKFQGIADLEYQIHQLSE